MAKRKTSLPPLTPRAREVVNYIVNAVALGTHDNDAEIGAVAKKLGTTPGRLITIVRKLEEQGYVTVKNDFVYPTVAALRWQNPSLSEAEAQKILRRLR
jgi:DNA-binding MarR family transcriptional regulator